ncbi:hypothetical protein TNCT_597771 [Trichonephila clavata]|uniref:Uncharacterized protein n=1 Tax=Trichonephila clavata TaxID=2740835 RepID=A0A8X6LCV4_TRICU|nr:hypothetical protein TNCT_597771 [Trichonephila clavata]
MDPRLYPKGARHESDAIPKRSQDIFGDGVFEGWCKNGVSEERATAEFEKIPTPLVESTSPPEKVPIRTEKIPTPPAESASPPENIPTPPENIPTPPAKRLVEFLPERPDTPLERVDPSLLMIGAHVEVTSRLPSPPQITRCDKSTQTNSSRLELGKRLLEQPPLLPNKRLAIQPETPVQQPPTIVLFVPNHHPVLKLGTRRFIIKPNPVNNVNK